MCLYNPQEVKLEEDLVVYKVFTRAVDGYHTPYYQDPARPWEARRMKEDRPVDELIHESPPGTGFPPYILGGGFHSFETREEADRECDWLNTNWAYGAKEYFVGKCVIPADSSFVYRGEYDCQEMWSYVSEKLMLVEVFD